MDYIIYIYRNTSNGRGIPKINGAALEVWQKIVSPIPLTQYSDSHSYEDLGHVAFFPLTENRKWL